MTGCKLGAEEAWDAFLRRARGRGWCWADALWRWWRLGGDGLGSLACPEGLC